MENILESQIHEELKKIIEKNELAEVIDSSEVKGAIDSLNNNAFIPSFSLDYMARKKLLKCADYILPKLGCLDLISSDKSISKEKGEVLRPDLISYNPEEKCFVVIEIKKDNQTAREAITELLAYEQEIQNHMPFCSSLDILFIIVSPVWSTLLDHAVTSAVTWSSHKILSLNYNPENKALSVHLPQAWSRLGIPNLPKESCSTVTLVGYGIDNDEPPLVMHNALNLMKEYGDRERLSGFCYLWQDWHPLSLSSWNISVCVFNPAEIYKFSCFSTLNQRISPICTYIEKNMEGMRFHHPSSMFSMIDKGKEYLSRFGSPTYESFTTWFSELDQNRWRSMPLVFRFFGELSEHSSDLINNDVFWDANIEALNVGQLDFSDPIMAIPFINGFFEREYLTNGVINLFEISKIGCLISIMQNTLKNYLAHHDEPMRKKAYFLCIYRWCQFKLISFVSEMKMLIASISEELPELPVIKVSDDQAALDSISDLKKWLIDLVDGSSIHKNVLLFSCSVGFLTEKVFADCVSEEDCIDIVNANRDFFSWIINVLNSANDCESLSDEKIKEILDHTLILNSSLSANLKKDGALKLIGSVLNSTPIFLDLYVEPLHFEVDRSDLSVLDWQEIKISYIDHFNSGKQDICVYLSSAGDLGIGQQEEVKMFSKTINPCENFAFLDERHAYRMIRIIAWQSVDDGSFFLELSNNANS